MRTAFITLFFTLMTLVTRAEAEKQTAFSQINIENGLSSNTIQCIYQDSEGIMWFGTNDGLSMYDTYKVTTWRNDPANPHSIGNNSIYCIFEDKGSRIWVGTEKGLYTYSKSTDIFQTIDADADLNSIHVRSISQDTAGHIWISTLGDGIFRLDPMTGKTRNWRHDPKDRSSLTSDYSPKVIADAMGSVWCLASGNCLYRYDAEKDSFIPMPICDSKTGVAEKNSYSMCLNWEGDLWIGGWNSGIFHYDKEEDTFTNYLTDNGTPILKGRIHTITELEPGRLLIGSDQGLTDFNYKTGRYRTHSYGQPEYGGLSDNFVHDIFVDREGGIWAATYFGGVNYMNPSCSNFVLRRCAGQSGKGRVISKFCENGDGKIWIGTDDGGIFIYDPKTGRCRQILLDKETPNLNIHALLKNGDTLWIGTYSNGLYQLDLKTGRISHISRFDGKSGMAQSIYSLFKDTTGRIWIGTKEGIWSWSEGKGFVCMKKMEFHSDVIEICSDAKGDIWFASISAGLLKYDPKTQTLENIQSHEDCVIPNEILSMGIHSNRLYLGTSGRGVVCYDINSGKTTSIQSHSHNMLNISVFHIINDEDNIWLSTNEGLIRYNLISEKATIFGKSDGLRTDIFNNNSGIKSSDGLIYLGTNDGFNVFRPDEIQTNLTAPSTTFTQCTFPNLRNGDHIVIRKGHAPFTIGFSALSYRSPQRNRYRYTMTDIDKDWHETAWNNNSVTFSDLRCGTYTFSVCSCNNDGIWGDPISAEITVKPYWWNCTFAIVIYIILGISLLIGIIATLIMSNIQKKKNRAQKIKHVKEKTRIETELQFFTNLAHEIKTPVMLINAPIKEIAETEGLPKKVQDKISLIKKSSDRLNNLTNEILNFRKCSSDMKIMPMHITQATRQIVDEFMPVVYTENITLRFVDNTDGKVVADINPEAWNKIISNLMTNAIKYTKDLIEVKAETADGFLYISVFDNGAGIAPDMQKKIFQAFWHYDKTAVRSSAGFGLGLSITSMLVHQMGMKIKVESESGKYTEFRISIPLTDSETSEGEPAEIIEEKIQEEVPKNVPAKTDDPIIKSRNSVTLMIIDNDDDMRLYLASTLSDTYRIVTASDGDEALQILKSERLADLIISDISMPVMNGIELCNHLRKDINLCHIPIILLSADSDMATKLQSAENGADMYIDKPVDIAYLKTQIRNLLDRRKALWDSFSKRPYLSMPSFAENERDKDMLKMFSDVILKDLSNPDLSVNDLAEKMHMSRSILFKKIKTLTGMTPNNFIKTMRLRKAAELLIQGKHKINEICWMVGFNTPSYFSKCFNQNFGMNPKEFVAKNRPEETEGNDL